MQDLTLVGVDDDGGHLLLELEDGTRCRLVVDDSLRAAVRRDRLGQVPVEAPRSLTPREIQARVRAGEDAVDIAATGGVGVEHVRRYEGPVLAEREHAADRARALPVRWRDGSGRSPRLEDLVAERLAARGSTGPTLWDAWRREDGVWVVQLAFRAGSRERRAEWTFDVSRGALEALDDESRWLSSVSADGQGPLPGGGRTGADAEGPDSLPGRAVGRRLGVVREEVYDVDDAGRATRGERGAAGAGEVPEAEDAGDGDEGGQGDVEVAARAERQGRTLDLLEHLRGRRGRRQPLADPGEEDDEVEALTWSELEALTNPPAPEPDATDATAGTADAGSPTAEGDAAEDEAVTAELARMDRAGAQDPPAAHPPASRPDQAVDAEVLALPDLEDAGRPAEGAQEPPAGGRGSRGRSRRSRGVTPGQGEVPVDDASFAPARPGAGPGEEPEDPAEQAPEDVDAGQKPERAPRRGSRPSVPSWDDIVFGSRRD